MNHAALDREAMDAAARAIGEYLMEANRLAAPIHSLTMPELQGMASAAIAGWIVKRSEQAKENPDLWDSILGT